MTLEEFQQYLSDKLEGKMAKVIPMPEEHEFYYSNRVGDFCMAGDFIDSSQQSLVGVQYALVVDASKVKGDKIWASCPKHLMPHYIGAGGRFIEKMKTNLRDVGLTIRVISLGEEALS